MDVDAPCYCPSHPFSLMFVIPLHARRSLFLFFTSLYSSVFPPSVQPECAQNKTLSKYLPCTTLRRSRLAAATSSVVLENAKCLNAHGTTRMAQT